MSHALLSPSSSSRWLNCPGSAELTLPLLDQEESSEYADEGTFAHSIAERAIKAAIAGDGDAVKALKDLDGTKSDCGRFVADSAMCDHLFEYVHHAVELGRSCPHWIEAEVEVVPDKVYGTADFVAVDGPILEVADLKYGAGVPVSPVGNTQAMTYAAGAYGMVSSLDTLAGSDIETVRIHIFQPRNSQGGGTWEMTLENLLLWRDEVLIPGAERIVPGADIRVVKGLPLASGPWCRFCPARATCPQMRADALAATKEVFTDLTELETAPAPPDLKSLTPERLAKALEAAPLVEAWIKAIREHALELALKGQAVPGWKAVKKTGNRRWKDEKAAEEMLREMLPDDVEPFEKPKLLSPAKAEKKLDPIGKALLVELVTKPDTGFALVPASDKRPAFVAADVFPCNES